MNRLWSRTIEISEWIFVEKVRWGRGIVWRVGGICGGGGIDLEGGDGGGGFATDGSRGRMLVEGEGRGSPADDGGRGGGKGGTGGGGTRG